MSPSIPPSRSISSLFIERPVMTILVMLALLFFGSIAYRALPVAALPDAEYPTVEITTSYPGTNPQTMADTVTSPIERACTGIDGVKTIASSSASGNATIILQFSPNKEKTAILQEVQAAINRASASLPSDLPAPPTYQNANPAQTPIIYFSIASDAMSLGTLYEYAYSLIGRKLGTVEGVAEVLVYGSKFAIRVQVDPDKLAARQIGIDEIAKALVSSNARQPVGNLDGPDTTYAIDVDGEMRSSTQYEELIIRNRGGASMKLKEVGRACDSVQNDKSAVYHMKKGEATPCVVIGIMKQRGANTIEVVEAIRKEVEQIGKELPKSIALSTLFDQSTWITQSIRDVKLTLVIAFTLVLCIVFFYLGKPLHALIPLFALPLSVAATCIPLYLFGFSLDILSLLAITLSIGFLIDDAIVVLENIARHIEMGRSAWEAALSGSKEIAPTILSTTLCLASAFIPLIFMQGAMGTIFREFGITIAIAVLISGFISLTLTPMLASLLIEKSSRGKNRIEKISEALNARLLSLYKRGIEAALNHPIRLSLIGALAFLGTISLGLSLQTDFFPPEDLGFIQGFARASDATSPQKMARYQEELSRIICGDPDVDEIVAVSGVPHSNASLFFIRLKQKERLPMKKAIPNLLKKLRAVPGVDAFLKPISLINFDVGTGASMGSYQYTLQSLDSANLYKEAAALVEKMRHSPHYRNVTTDMEGDALYAQLHIDRERAYDLNISAEAIERALRYAYSGSKISSIEGKNDQYDLILETIPSASENPALLDKIYISSDTPSAKQVPLSSISGFTEKTGPLTIAHINTLPSVTISYDLTEGTALSTALSHLQKLAKTTLSQGVFPLSIGSAQIFTASFTSLISLFTITLFLLYAILGILYESYLHPLTVISSLLPAALGGVLTLILFDQPLSLYAFVGIIMLLGISLKNGIILVDFANEEIAKGSGATEAMRKACRIRFRPILMTTLAAMMGAVPIACGMGGATADATRPLGLIVIGGLLASQAFTLFLTPAIFLLLERGKTAFLHRDQGLG